MFSLTLSSLALLFGTGLTGAKDQCKNYQNMALRTWKCLALLNPLYVHRRVLI